MTAELEIRREYGRDWGGTTYQNPTWGVNIYSLGECGWFRWQGWPANTKREAGQMLHEMAGQFPEAQANY